MCVYVLKEISTQCLRCLQDKKYKLGLQGLSGPTWAPFLCPFGVMRSFRCE